MKQNLFGTIIPDAFIARLEAARDPAAEGLAICLDLIGALVDTPGVAGVHVMAPGNDAAIPGVLDKARRALPAARRSDVDAALQRERARSR